ncbi:MAG: hypothetical protein ACREGH_00290 [Minisyncoccia bacterium]
MNIATPRLDPRRFREETHLRVNLGAEPTPPYVGATPLGLGGHGWVTVEKKDGVLWVGGCKVELYIDDRQKNNKTITASDLHEQLKLRCYPVLHPNILDALLQRPEYIPEEWKCDARGRAMFIYFWGQIFKGPTGAKCVRCVYFDGLVWRPFYRWFGVELNDQHAAAI